MAETTATLTEATLSEERIAYLEGLVRQARNRRRRIYRNTPRRMSIALSRRMVLAGLAQAAVSGPPGG